MSLWPNAGFAQTQQPPDVPTDFRSVEQARQAFNAAGYVVEQVQAWDWAWPPVSSFQVIDPARDRILMVLVYPSAVAASAALLEGQTHDQALNAGVPVGGNSGPHLVLGYGPSTWDGNVALVETSGVHLAQMYKSQVDQDNGLQMSPGAALGFAETQAEVHADFQQALRSSVANL
jgi:hypothetical protein